MSEYIYGELALRVDEDGFTLWDTEKQRIEREIQTLKDKLEMLERKINL